MAKWIPVEADMDYDALEAMHECTVDGDLCVIMELRIGERKDRLLCEDGMHVEGGGGN